MAANTESLNILYENFLINPKATPLPPYQNPLALYSSVYSVHCVQFEFNTAHKEFAAKFKRILISLHTHISVLK